MLGHVGAQISVVGSVDRVVVGPEVRNYDEYGFAFYPSVDAFEVVFTARKRVEARVRGMDARGELEDFMAEHDAERPHLGQTTFLCAKRSA